MTIPASLTVITVTGTILDGNGNPRSGSIFFRTPGFTMSGVDDTFVVPRTMTASLNASGHFSIALPSTTDPDWTPVNWTYRVTLELGDDGVMGPWDVLIPHDQGSPLSLASIAPVPSTSGLLYALYNDPRFSGTGGGGGAVSSVFGRTGAVVATTNDYSVAQINGLSAALSGKAASVHTHAESDVTSLVSDLSALATSIGGKASTVHTHAESDVTSLVSDLSAKAPLASPALTGTPTAPTASGGTNTTQVATTAFATAADSALLASTTPAASAVADTGTVGVGTTLARADHRHAREAFGTVTAQTSFGATSANGSAVTVARSDHTHGTPAAPAVPSASGTVASETSFGISANAGAAATFSRGDHTHGTPAAPGGSGSLKTVSQAKLTSGAITVASGTLTQVGSDLTIPASTGDILAIDIEALCNASSFALQFEAATRVSSANANYWSSGGAASLNPGGIPNWYVEGVSGKFGTPGGRAMYTVQAGDIVTGSVTVRLFGFGAGGARDVLASASYPMRWHLSNLGA